MKKIILGISLLIASNLAFASTENRCDGLSIGTRVEQIQKIATTMVALQNQDQAVIAKLSNMGADEKRHAEIQISQNQSEWAKCLGFMRNLFE